MSTGKRLGRLFETAPRIPFSNKSKIVLFSDCHRGGTAARPTILRKTRTFIFTRSIITMKTGSPILSLGTARNCGKIRAL